MYKEASYSQAKDVKSVFTTLTSMIFKNGICIVYIDLQ